MAERCALLTGKSLACALALGLPILAGSPASAQSPLPFHGSWGGGPATCSDPFRFDAKTYKPPGGSSMPIRKVEREAGGYLLSFDDDYQISLSDITRDSMSFYSPTSDSSFELTRCR